MSKNGPSKNRGIRFFLAFDGIAIISVESFCRIGLAFIFSVDISIIAVLFLSSSFVLIREDR